MNKRILWALLLIVLCVLVLVLNGNKITLSFGFVNFKVIAAFVYLGFTATGVVIGTLLR